MPRVESPCSTESLIQSFDAHLQMVRGAAAGTRAQYRRHAREFLQARYPEPPVDLTALRATDLIEFVTDRATCCQAKTAQGVASALRSFLRFLQLQGLCEAQLVGAVPTIAHRRLCTLPRSLTEEQLNALLSCFNRSTSSGLRGRAMALCMAQMALRAGEVARLSLEDIDWRLGTLLVTPGKTHRASLLPLPSEVGQAIEDYLCQGRPETQERFIFVRHLSPLGAPISASAVRHVIRQAFEKAGVDTPSKGTHILRHTAATRMLRQGATLKEIADVLRHRHLDTTTIYAKVDLARLAEVCLPWPGSES